MAILATVQGVNLFTSLPTTPPPQNHPSTTTPPPKPPIPIPKYPPPRKTQKLQNHPKNPKTSTSNIPAFKTHHHNSKYYKPIKPGQVLKPTTTPATTSAAAHDDDRSIIVGESGVSYRLPGAPFEFSFSYSETPKAKPLALREPAFLPFAPPSMPRPWTGKAPLKKKKTRKIKLFGGGDEENDVDNGESSVKYYEMLKAYELGKYEMRPREEVLGQPLSRMEIKELLMPLKSSNKQVNLGRDGLTHNMLELIHSHWRRQPVCKVRCLGVPTVDMDNICRCLEDKTGGKIIHRVGGVVYVFRGRNYDHRDRPKLPVMLWKPAAPVYPKLIQEAPEGLTKEEADELRIKGKNLLPICKLAKNGVYVTLVRDVRVAFEGCPLVKIDCKGMHASDYKKLGAKLKELVPCVLLSFDDEQILMWRGRDWKPRFRDASPTIGLGVRPKANVLDGSENQSVNFSESEAEKVRSSPRMMSLWQRAVETGKALRLDEINLGPDDLLTKVEQFESISQVTEHSYPALILSGKDSSNFSRTQNESGSEDDDYSEDETYYSEDVSYDKDYINNSFEVVESSLPLGSLPVDFITEELSNDE